MRLQMWKQIFEDGLLHSFAFGRGLDDEISFAQFREVQCRMNARQGTCLICGRDFLAAHLALKVAVNQRYALVQLILADIIQPDFITCQGADMRDAIAHLACAYDADFADFHR